MKIKLSSVLDLSRFLSTKSGQELKDVLEYLSQLSEQVITALTSNLSFPDNFSCEVKQLSIRSGVTTVVKPTRDITVTDVKVRRIYDNNYFIVDSVGWNYDTSGDINFHLAVKDPPTDESYQILVDIIIFYG